MIKPRKLNKGDKVAIVSLSMGLLGKDSVKHELDIALKRLKEDSSRRIPHNLIDSLIEKIQEKKDALIGTNINNPRVNEDMKTIFQAIRNIQLQMGEDVKEKIAEIKGRKGL